MCRDKILLFLATCTNGSRRGKVVTATCLSVFQHDISKTDAAWSSKLNIQMFHSES